MKRLYVPAVGAFLLQGLCVTPAHANADWNRYANSGYEYCDAVMLGAFWGEGVEQAKITIGRKIGWGNGGIVADNLESARSEGQRCAFDDTGFVYEDAEAVATLWGVSVWDAKTALAEKVSTGWRGLAEEVVAEAHGHY